jgi:hypothetical protein
MFPVGVFTGQLHSRGISTDEYSTHVQCCNPTTQREFSKMKTMHYKWRPKRMPALTQTARVLLLTFVLSV